MPYPERLLSPGENVDREFRPHWKRIIWPSILLVAALAAVVVVALKIAGTAKWITIGAIVVVVLAVILPTYLNWWFTRYVITNERLIVRSGVLSRHGKEIPLEVINDVAFSQTLGERLLRSGDLLIESAGEQGQSRFSDVPHPEDVQSVIYQLRENRTVTLSGGPGTSPAGQLEALARLHADGILSDEEFEEKRKKLLDEI